MTFASPVFDGEEAVGVVHIELTMDDLRTKVVNNAGDAIVRVLDPSSGAVILDSQYTQAADAPLGRPDDQTFTLVVGSMGATGRMDAGDDRVAYTRLADQQNDAGRSDAEWVVTASRPGTTDPTGARMSTLASLSSHPGSRGPRRPP